MDCAQNAFCGQLPRETRERLCSGCKRRFLKAGSIQLNDDFRQNCVLVLDGLFVSRTNTEVGIADPELDSPGLFLGFPGRLINLDVSLGYQDIGSMFASIDFEYLTDTWIAAFDHRMIRRLYDEDPGFREGAMRSQFLISADSLLYTALFRANYTYQGVFHLISLLADHNLHLSQQQLAIIMNHDRSSISKAFSRIRKGHAATWEKYARNRGRVPSRPTPGGGRP